MDRLKKSFIGEAQALLNGLEAIIIDFEKDPYNLELVNQIFRVMHTLKGSGGMFGFEHLSGYTHKMETLYNFIREGEITVNKDLFEITLASVDHLRNLLHDEFLQDEQLAKIHQFLTSKLEAIYNDEGKLVKNDTVILNAPAHDNFTEQTRTYYIIFYPDDSLFFRGVNLLNIFRDLYELGHYEIVNHNFSEPFDLTGDETIAWGIYLATDKGLEAINNVLLFVNENFKVLKVSDYNLFNKEEFMEKLNKLSFSRSNQQSLVIQDEISETMMKPIESSEVENSLKENDQMEVPENKVNSQPEVVIVEKNDPVKSARTHAKQEDVRISVESSKLDNLMHLVNELITVNSELKLLTSHFSQTRFELIAEKVDALSKQFRENTLKVRLVSTNELVVRFKRLVRDLSKELGKKVNFIIDGTDTELDKNIVDNLSEPIMHIIRNCIDHGIEIPEERIAAGKTPDGNLKFSSFYSGSYVYIRIQDDGRGINHEAIRRKAIEKRLIDEHTTLSKEEIINMVFTAGFSTAHKVTEVSGRGVGMDIVKQKIASLHGEVVIDSEPGLGTVFTIKLNQSISILDTMLVKTGSTHFLIPIADIEFCDQYLHDELIGSYDYRIEYNNTLVPFVYIREVLKIAGNPPQKEKVIIVNKNDNRYAIVVDQIIGEHEAVLKPLGDAFKNNDCLMGGSLLGDGSLAFMLDTNKLKNTMTKYKSETYE